MGMLSLTSPVFVAAVMFDKDTTATIQNFSLDGSSFPSEPFPCKANTPYAFNCDEVLLGTANVTVATSVQFPELIAVKVYVPAALTSTFVNVLSA